MGDCLDCFDYVEILSLKVSGIISGFGAPDHIGVEKAN